MSGGNKRRGHPEVWASLTLMTFPVVLVATDILGIGGLWPFFLAMAATLGVLILEALVRGRLWPFEDKFSLGLEHPDTPVRILLFAGATLLILETALIYVVALDRRFDLELLSFIARKQCAARQIDPVADKVCKLLTDKQSSAEYFTRGDALGYALRKHAAQIWFPHEPLITCAERKITPASASQDTCRYATLMHCTAWKIKNGVILPAASRTKAVGANLVREADGLFRVAGWTENPNTPDWDATLGDAAQVARDKVYSLTIPAGMITILQAEALGRAQDQLLR